MNFRDKWVLVTGASSGLGLEIARALARDHRANVIAVARRKSRLDSLKTELEEKHGVQVLPLEADLSKPADVQRVFDEATSDRSVYAVVLNAGVTFYGNVLEQTHETFETMLATNVSSTVQLSKAFANHLSQNGQNGGILLVSSLSCFAPLPYQTTYAATKSFITSYGRGLGHELKGRGVSVTVFAPGGIDTELLDLSGLSQKFKSGDFGIMPAERCAQLAVRALQTRRDLYVPGLFNQVLAAAMKVLPHSWVLPPIARIYQLRDAVLSKEKT
jgi:short-subunit dehydrogenase